MLFNSIGFAVFLPIVFVLYWFATRGNQKIQNVLLLVASYYFYACWDWRFLFLLVFSTLLDYYTGLRMAEAKTHKIKAFWFWLSIVVNLGFLGIFKYYNFFADSLAEGLSLLGIHTEFWTLQVILPVGISFYTFHGLSYVIDIYKDKIKPEKNVIDYAVFVSFFPLLVAGPIERATHLLPQIQRRRDFNYTKAKEGLRQILWGLFKKVVIADNCAELANLIFNNHENYSGSSLVIGAVLFAFQIYGDFSGYSDIAIGTAKLFGIDLLKNFAFPYFSRDIAEFWRRWHISLSSWFRDYLYIPLGGSKGGMWAKVRNVFVIFLVSGFWHGANWTFVAWGFVNALFIMPSILFDTNRNHLDIVAQGRIFPTLKEFLSVFITFCMTVFCWIFFRSANLSHAISYIDGIFSMSFFTIPDVKLGNKLWFLLPFIIIEWFGREQEYAVSKIEFACPALVRWGFYYTVIIAVLYFAGTKQQFIYFQF